MTTRKEYVFKAINGIPVAADVYFRKTTIASKLPIALHFHGGNFTVGSKQMLPRDQSEKLLDLGFVVVSANYRLAPTVTVFEGPVKDALDAYEWSRTKLPQLLLEDAHVKADGSRIVTLGHSCGGTLALLTASSPQPPRATLDIYGIKYLADSAFHVPLPAPPGAPQIDQDFTSKIWKDDPPPTSAPPPVGPKGPNLANYRVAWMFDQLGKGTHLKTVVGDGDYDRVDPASLFSKGRFPPTFFIHGAEDKLVPARLSQQAYDELKRHGVETELVLVEGGQHGFDEIGQPENALELLEKGFEFLKAHV
ncbi:hypothetical protein FOXG_01373 [Fusarium oxysporum f. sp. lycopersici 4287]|uniref:Alpha/beta hydrolase fold-3 domain-containing protein n=2 Tax=Fusarium oxysporum TaxID=5507 RepID=A0A0J9WH20_FUSO4|nr:hypothetical protein FOXG_01373 [Fusarium oxysporum f. sp. lycopersici 4287]EXK49735.1 hypothetical protein FOMG_02218 [Fusarium oxysporum f. sp. melonis 26406]KNA96016.1 hypothetical protein FOXG_01373 [Fusarium oxysporum f. sp. lycopersici 4287]